jgi:Flp pilus assembly protein TadG
MVNTALTGRAVLHEGCETLRQSVSAISGSAGHLSRAASGAYTMPFASIASFCRLLRRFRRNREGSAMIEFMLIAPLFFGLLFAIIETAIMFFASQVLETITQEAARMVMTGQAQTGQMAACNNTPCTQATFKTYVCQQIPAALFNCNNIYVDIENYSNFQNITLPTPIDKNGNFVNNTGYNPGASSTCINNTGCSNSIVVVRLYYAWQLFVTGLGYNISNMNGNQRLLMATAVFRNEPF